MIRMAHLTATLFDPAEGRRSVSQPSTPPPTNGGLAETHAPLNLGSGWAGQGGRAGACACAVRPPRPQSSCSAGQEVEGTVVHVSILPVPSSLLCGCLRFLMRWLPHIGADAPEAKAGRPSSLTVLLFISATQAVPRAGACRCSIPRAGCWADPCAFSGGCRRSSAAVCVREVQLLESMPHET